MSFITIIAQLVQSLHLNCNAFIIMGHFLCFLFLIWDVGALWGVQFEGKIVNNFERKLFSNGWKLELLKNCLCSREKEGQHVYLCNRSLGEERLASKLMKSSTTLYELRRFRANQSRNLSYYMLTIHIIGSIKEKVYWKDTLSMRYEPNHIKNWHHCLPKTLMQWINRSFIFIQCSTFLFYLRWDLDSHLHFQHIYCYSVVWDICLLLITLFLLYQI